MKVYFGEQKICMHKSSHRYESYHRATGSGTVGSVAPKDVDRPKALLGREMPAEARHAPLPQVHRITKWERAHGPRAVRGAGGGGLHLNLGARMGTVSLIIPFPTVPSAA